MPEAVDVLGDGADGLVVGVEVVGGALVEPGVLSAGVHPTTMA